MLSFSMSIPVTPTMTTAELREIIGHVADDVDVSDTGVHEYQLHDSNDVIVTWTLTKTE